MILAVSSLWAVISLTALQHRKNRSQIDWKKRSKPAPDYLTSLPHDHEIGALAGCLNGQTKIVASGRRAGTMEGARNVNGAEVGAFTAASIFKKQSICLQWRFHLNGCSPAKKKKSLVMADVMPLLNSAISASFRKTSNDIIVRVTDRDDISIFYSERALLAQSFTLHCSEWRCLTLLEGVSLNWAYRTDTQVVILGDDLLIGFHFT